MIYAEIRTTEKGLDDWVVEWNSLKLDSSLLSQHKIHTDAEDV
jgi:hypothetical protein